jgi:hypothetical protein
VYFPDILTHDTWHYIELNWKWNDAAGFTKLYIDGVEIISSTAGNTKSRSTGTYIEQAPLADIWMDDFTIWDEVRHSSNFSPPSFAQCPGQNIVLNFGRPGGWGFGYGFGN